MLRSDWVATIRRRLGLLHYALLIVAALLGLRFWNLQIVRGDEFAEIARHNYLRSERLRAPRGLVLDRKGRTLAESEPSFALIADAPGIARLEELGALPDADAGELDALRRRAARGPAVVRTGLDFEEVAYLDARRSDLPGVQVDFIPVRRYPLGAATAHLLGYAAEVTPAQLLLEEFVAASDGDIVGHTGVERAYNTLLSGVDGQVDLIVDSRERIRGGPGVRATDPVRGGTLRLSVSGALQEAALAAFGEESGAFAALDIATGAILGLGSYPAEDPTLFRRDASVFRELLRHPRTPLLNRAIQGGFPPGSGFKLITAAAALAEGVVDEDHRVNCTGRTRVGGRTFHCHRTDGHGEVNLLRALAESCNVYFYRIASQMDVDVLAGYARAFGLGAPTGVDLLGEVSGLVPTREWKRETYGERWYPSETASVAVGQGAMVVTPLQMARVVAAIASGGRLLSPGLTEPGPAGVVEGIAPEHLELIRAGMREAVLSGTAARARIPGFAAAGKTGTAQVASAERVADENEDRPWEFRTHAWFLGFAPYEDPEIAIAVLVEHGGAGSSAATPIGREILTTWRDERSSGEGGAVDLAAAR